VVQPDILVLCDRRKLDKKGYGMRGAPDMVVEILSPSSTRMDRVIKHKKYQQYGVREYWLVDPLTATVEVHLLNDGQFKKAAQYNAMDSIPVQVLPGCHIDLSEVFAEIIATGIPKN